ncbi:MAG: hypothetical protein VKM34_12105 [Cyanobacteriota bacterium]|nr:hypothetical protein [Cyanobacteriota bacterium]
MAALLLLLLIIMAGYAWLLSPAIALTTGVLKAQWLLWLPLLLAIWLLANRDP